MRLLLLPIFLTLTSCFNSDDFFHDKVGMGKGKSHLAQYMEVELINHVDSIGRGSEDPKCNLKNNCKFYYGRGTSSNPFDNQGLNVETDSKDLVQSISWWFKFNPSLVSLQLDTVKMLPTVEERFKDDKPDLFLTIDNDGRPIKIYQLFWRKKWGYIKADAFCFGNERDQARKCHVSGYKITYKTPNDFWEKIEKKLKAKPISEISW